MAQCCGHASPHRTRHWQGVPGARFSTDQGGSFLCPRLKPISKFTNFKTGSDLGHKKKPPLSVKNWLRDPLANQGSCGARHADNIGPPFFSSQNELASRAGKSSCFFQIWLLLSPTLNQSGEPIPATALSCRRNAHRLFRRAFRLRKTIVYG